MPPQAELSQEMETPEELLAVRDLFVYVRRPSDEAPAVRGVSFTLGRREVVAIVGESGAGKSLTGLSILRLTPPTIRLAGEISFGDRNLLQLSRRELRAIRGAAIAVIYQDPLSALNPVWSVSDQIAEAIRAHEEVSRRAAREQVLELLARVRLPNPRRVADSFPHEISGGMRQRVLIAMALACGPQLLIADEPTTALDVTVQKQILDLLGDLRDQEDLSILLITHDMGVVAQLADRVLVMYAGAVVEEGRAESVLLSPAHPYTEALLASASLASERGMLRPVPGAPPALGAAPPGCPFRPRCAYSQPACAEEEPGRSPFPHGGHGRCLFPVGSGRQ